uniref:Uncharacterized protein n=1 Tax=viral metagenome TaxID=1070528 RepID=A0A6C0JMK6_9ZZZZ
MYFFIYNYEEKNLFNLYMSALGNGSLTGFSFNKENVLSNVQTSATQPVPVNYNSKLIGGRKRKHKLSSLRSLKSNKNLGFSLKSRGGSKKSRKNRKHKKRT